MPLLKVKKGDYENDDAIHNLIKYIATSEFTNPYLTGSIATLNNSIENMIFHFELVQAVWNKANSKRVQHLIVGISGNELLTIGEIFNMGYIIANYIGQWFQVVFSVHAGSKSNEDNQHIHFAVNTVSYVDGMRFYGTNTEYYNIISFAKNNFGDELKWKLCFD